MKEATLTSAHVAGKSTKSVDFSPFYCNIRNIAKSLINFIASESFAIALLSITGIATFYAAVLESPALPWIAIVAVASLTRILIPMTKGGQDE